MILTLTLNPSIDTSTRLDKMTPNKKLRCERPRKEPGGGGINVSRAIKILGGKSVAVFSSGGNNGKLLADLLKKEGISVRPVNIKQEIRENIMIKEAAVDDQFRFIMPGPNLEEAEWKEFLNIEKLLDEKPDFIVASGSLPDGVPADFYRQVAEAGKKIGAKVIIDASGEALFKSVESDVFLIKPNINEIKQLIDGDFEVENELEKAASELIKRKNIENLVISLGSGGALLVNKNSTEYFRTPTVKVKSRVGAGDSTVAGIVLKLSEGKSIKEAVKYGIAAGAAAVMTPGTELCRRDDTERLFKMMS